MMKPEPAGALWFEVPLYLPDWVRIEMVLNCDRRDKVMWGGIEVKDGRSDQRLVLTAEPFPPSRDGLEQALNYIRNVALRHMDPGEPFPA